MILFGARLIFLVMNVNASYRIVHIMAPQIWQKKLKSFGKAGFNAVASRMAGHARPSENWNENSSVTRALQIENF